MCSLTHLTFTIKSPPTFKLNCSKLTPNNLAGLSIDQIAKLKLGDNKNSPQVADFFDIHFEKMNQKDNSGTDTQNIIFKNTNENLDFIGANMSQGSITVCGDVGDRLGDKMRRGTILVEGNAGDYAGSRMVAGTIGILGTTGAYTGYAMKRGTILLKEMPQLHATIQDCGTHNLPYLALLFQSFKTLPSKFNQLKNQRVQRFAGDIACNGNGEILVLL